MNRRTPRRRISPRTVKRYQAIKNFVRRALGSSSQRDIKTNSSITLSVLDLRQKIDGIEQQLNTVSKHCQDLATLESKLQLKNLDSEKCSDTDIKNIKETKKEILYKTPQDQSRKQINHRSTFTGIICDDEAGTKLKAVNEAMDQNYSDNFKENRKSKHYHRLDTIEENEQTLRRRRNRTTSRTLPSDVPICSTHSLREPKIFTRFLDASYSEEHRQRNRKKMKCFNTSDGIVKLNSYKERTCGDHRDYKNKYARPDLDQDFIADIIRTQYRPVKLFGRRDSDFSQFSAPVCRDQEFTTRETLKEGSDLCSCCHEEQRRYRHSRYMYNNDVSDIRSICDTRLYSSKKHKRHTNQRKHLNDFYNDSTMYDVIPVKEKSSPKSRRKFVEDNTLIQDNYREVPPSPRSQRPRLNLQAQLHTEDDKDSVIPFEKQLRNMKRIKQKSLIQNRGNVSNVSSESFIHNRNLKCMQNSQILNNPKSYNEECVGTMTHLQFPILTHEQGKINDTTQNTQITDISADKTDKTLGEIKDILQSFLQEIKKESSESEKLNHLPQPPAQSNVNEIQQKIKSNSFNNSYNFGHCGMPPFIQSFPNSCCYPILPVCPINCMQNGYVLPSPSFTCATCAKSSKERTCGSNDVQNKTNIFEDASSETQKLIKEIHNLISQNPNSNQKNKLRNDCGLILTNKNEEKKPLITNSADGNSKTSKQNARVGTRNLKCYSKSCEAIGSREATDTHYVTNASYSDTVLEMGSGEEITTRSASESEYSSETTVINKTKGNKFKKILRSIGILKRSKTDVLEELTKSDSSMNVAKAKQKSTFQTKQKSHPSSPFQQHIINYNMHGQEYFQPPIAPNHQLQYEYRSHPSQYDSRTCYSPTNIDNKNKNSQARHCQEQDMRTHYASPHQIPRSACASYYDPYYINVPPQVPLCLKEIEVKSIGTQSVRKISLLEKLTNKMQVPVQQMKESSPKQSSIRTFTKDKNSRDKSEPILFDWKKIHEKAMQKTTDPLKFTYKTQKRLAEGDNTMRKAMLKKLFYKRNPFSPRNLLVRTLLGKDRSSFGEPPKMYKPRMFL